jgi:quercetin dioxygenase-like cupin family protein
MHGLGLDVRIVAAVNLPAITQVRTSGVRARRARQVPAADLPSVARPPTRNPVREGTSMQITSLTAKVDQHLIFAREASSGRSSVTVYGGHEHALRQTLIALAGGRRLEDHESPGEATMQVLHGRVRLTSGGSAADGTLGDLLVIPPGRHALGALEDRAAVLLTVAVHV